VANGVLAGVFVGQNFLFDIIFSSVALMKVQVYLIHGVLTLLLSREDVWLIRFLHFEEPHTVFIIFFYNDRIELLNAGDLFQSLVFFLHN
jgi:hypothetical protein